MFTLKVIDDDCTGMLMADTEHALGGKDLVQAYAFSHLFPSGCCPWAHRELVFALAESHGWQVQVRKVEAAQPQVAIAAVRELPDGRTYLRIFPHGYAEPLELPVSTSEASGRAAGCWTWNGSLTAPTLRPSIKTWHADETVSHFWLSDGVCQYLDDSRDGFAGSSLPLRSLPTTSTDHAQHGN